MNKKDFIELIQTTHAPLKGLVEMVPDDKLDWAPGKSFMTVGQVLKHISENWSIIRMLVTGKWPFTSEQQMADMMKLENIPSCSKTEAIQAMERDLKDSLEYIEKEISQEDFFNKVVTAPWGFQGELWKAILMAQEHFLNHKMQLFLYLKMLGFPVNTGLLYGM